MKVIVFNHTESDGCSQVRLFNNKRKAMREASAYIRELGLKPEWDLDADSMGEPTAMMSTLSHCFTLTIVEIEEGD